MNKSVDIFNARLKRIMKECKIKNIDIAKALGKSKNQISNYFTGDSVPPWNYTCLLIELLQKRIGKIDLNTLYGNIEENDLLITIHKLKEELFNLKTAYEKIVIEYICLKDKAENHKKLV